MNPRDLLLNYGNSALVDRFLSHIEVNERGCWLWTAALDKHGYGVMAMPDRSKMRAHRLAYHFAFGSLPSLLDHVECDTRRCANPYHVQPSTQQKNTLRGTGPTAVNAKKTHCYRGHLLPTESTKRHGRRCKQCRKELRH